MKPTSLKDRYCGTCNTICDWVYEGMVGKARVFNHWCPKCEERPTIFREEETNNATWFDTKTLYQTVNAQQRRIVRLEKELDSANERLKKLDELEAAGVDNWEGYDGMMP